MLKKTRDARRIVRERIRTNSASARIARRGEGSLTTYALSTGLAPKAARTVAGSLRRNAAKLGVTGTEHRVHAGRHMRTTHRYTPAQVAAVAANYRPRVDAYRDAANVLRLAA